MCLEHNIQKILATQYTEEYWWFKLVILRLIRSRASLLLSSITRALYHILLAWGTINIQNQKLDFY